MSFSNNLVFFLKIFFLVFNFAKPKNEALIDKFGKFMVINERRQCIIGFLSLTKSFLKNWTFHFPYLFFNSPYVLLRQSNLPTKLLWFGSKKIKTKQFKWEVFVADCLVVKFLRFYATKNFEKKNYIKWTPVRIKHQKMHRVFICSIYFRLFLSSGITFMKRHHEEFLLFWFRKFALKISSRTISQSCEDTSDVFTSVDFFNLEIEHLMWRSQVFDILF